VRETLLNHSNVWDCTVTCVVSLDGLPNICIAHHEVINVLTEQNLNVLVLQNCVDNLQFLTHFDWHVVLSTSLLAPPIQNAVCCGACHLRTVPLAPESTCHSCRKTTVADDAVHY